MNSSISSTRWQAAPDVGIIDTIFNKVSSSYIKNRIKFLHNQVGECLDIIGISDDELNDFLDSQKMTKQTNE